MPEFSPQFTPSGLDSFTAGYFRACEWVGIEDPEEVRRGGDDPGNIKPLSEARAFLRATVKRHATDCREFKRANEADLETYCEVSGRAMEGAGVDFYLSRCGHGAGYFDGSNHPVFDRLQKAAQGMPDEGSFYVCRRGYIRDWRD